MSSLTHNTAGDASVCIEKWKRKSRNISIELQVTVFCALKQAGKKKLQFFNGYFEMSPSWMSCSYKAAFG